MKENIENALRPVLKNVGLVGTRGPANKHVLLITLVAILAIVVFISSLINIYEFFFEKKCPVCGAKHDK